MQTFILQLIQMLAPIIRDLFYKLHGTDPKYKDYTPGQMFDECLNNIDTLQAKLDAEIAKG